MNSVSSIDKKIAELEAEKAKLIEEQKHLTALTLDQQVAIVLHDRLCRWNHTDGCGWFYFIKNGVPTWQEHSQQDYLKKAALLIRVVRPHVDHDADIIPFIESFLGAIK